MNSNSTQKRGPASLWIGALAFLLPFVSLVTRSGVSIVSFLILISSLILFKPCRNALVRYWPQVRWVVLAFLLHFLYVLACKLVRGAPMSSVEKPARMFFACSALLVVLGANAPRRALWWGVSGGALVGLPFIAWQRFGLHLERPGGLINAITFGDLALLLGLLSLAAAIDLRQKPLQSLWAAAGALAGLAASVLTGSRGGWAALLLVLPLLIRHTGALDSRRARGLLLAGVGLLAATWFVPALGVQARFIQGMDEARTWYTGGPVFTNVGTRLELWKGALMLISEHPLFGMDFAACWARLHQYAQQGHLDPMVLTLPHLHNDGLQQLATGGIVGFLIWGAILFTPLVFFVRQLKAGARSPQFTVALAGALVVLGYAGFGLTEVIFWSVTGSLFYALMVFMLMGFCLNAKEKIG
ncbi:O-antigen ligase [Massilia sp. 9096]|uniref:O-antigen ligase family protein n=1 Tax=Massilia sp. 9096 TaxID=1500894 RepID=UPI00055DD39B|nr:O-antigen ligase family protein [Massilia sp. 9096]